MTIEGTVLRVTDKQVSQALVDIFKHRFHGGEDVFLSLCMDCIRRLKEVNRDNALTWHDHTDHHDHIKRAVDALCEVMPFADREKVGALVQRLIKTVYDEYDAQRAEADRKAVSDSLAHVEHVKYIRRMKRIKGGAQ